MSRGTVNKVILIGRLGADPELRYTSGGTPVANFNIATDESWTDSSGQKQERTEWHSIVAWSRSAERCSEYLSKGSRVYIEGRLQTRSWEGQDGVKRYKTEIVARNIEMLDSRQDSGSYREADYKEARTDAGAYDRSPENADRSEQQEPQDDQLKKDSEQAVEAPSDEDDDLPF